jgi:small-conductance mechanosensitive channel
MPDDVPVQYLHKINLLSTAMKIRTSVLLLLTGIIILVSNIETIFPQISDTQDKFPVTLDSDTLFFITEGMGIFTADKRADEITAKLNLLYKNEALVFDSIKILKKNNYLLLDFNGDPLMAVIQADADQTGVTDSVLAENYRTIIINKLNETREVYSQKNLIKNGLLTLLYLGLLLGFIWITSKIFPLIYSRIEKLEYNRIKNFKVKDRILISAEAVNKTILILLKGFSFALSLFAVYLFITNTIELWPLTRKLNIQPVIKSIALVIFYSSLFYAVIKSLNSLVKLNINKYDSWKGTRIKSISIKTVELLPVDRIIDFLKLLTKAARFALTAIIFYTYLTIIFSLFSFSETWAATLLAYVLNPLNAVWTSLLNFLPNLFFIIVLVFVFYYLIKGVKFFFLEISKGTLIFSNFHREWAIPTYKIVRFLILVLAAIVIFPYLPGSDSPFFQGISVFLGILFSLGSSSAIANMVAGIVLTYMRPFKIGDRVKIADTMGDVIERTLLVTRVRTVKNVDITIPNAMVLGSHIINYSSSADEKGLILHTTLTIGYDVPWKKVHELLLSAAGETELVLKEPKPFVLQTSLNDFYVSYELNVYTNNSQEMYDIYSNLHSRIHDKFDESGVEIMSPHFSALRDGNKSTIPQDYLPKEYHPAQPGLFGTLFGSKPEKKE